MRLYKTITVFSTLIAVVTVVAGFFLLDAATLQVSFLRAIIASLLRGVGFAVSTGVLSTVLAVAGLSVIAFGAGVYTLSTRFRAEGMGNSQEDAGEE
jgi:Na+-translocating ferredoxin:NAD+ oxidoreductase RnfE subunit